MDRNWALCWRILTATGHPYLREAIPCPPISMTQTTRTNTSAEAEPKLRRVREQRTKPRSANDQRFARAMVAPAVGGLFLVTIAPLLFFLVGLFSNFQINSPQPMRL